MNKECLIKSFMLFFVILLILSCLQTTEKFAEIDFTKIQPNNPIPISLTLGDVVYYLISFEQLSEENKNKIIKILRDKTTDLGKKFMDFRENETNGDFYKTPVFLVSHSQISALKVEKLSFILTSDKGDYALTPKIKGAGDKYLFFNKELGLAYYAISGPNSDIVHINKNGFVKNFGLQKSGPFSEMNLNSFIQDDKIADNDKLNVNIVN